MVSARSDSAQQPGVGLPQRGPIAELSYGANSDWYSTLTLGHCSVQDIAASITSYYGCGGVLYVREKKGKSVEEVQPLGFACWALGIQLVLNLRVSRSLCKWSELLKA